MELSGAELHAAVTDRLTEIVDPCSAANGTNFNLVEMGLLKGIEFEDGELLVQLRVTAPGCTMIPYFLREIPKRVGRIPGVTTVDVSVDAGFDWDTTMMDPERRREYLARLRAGQQALRRERAERGSGN